MNEHAGNYTIALHCIEVLIIIDNAASIFMTLR